MTKQDFTLIADAIRAYNKAHNLAPWSGERFTSKQLQVLADAFKAINPKFDGYKWLRFIEEGR